MRRAGMVAERGLQLRGRRHERWHLGLTEGYSLMIGGPNDAVDRATPDLRDARSGEGPGLGACRAQSGQGISRR